MEGVSGVIAAGDGREINELRIVYDVYTPNSDEVYSACGVY